MRILIACEYSGRVRNAFLKLGHDVMSCDLLESEDNSPHHYVGDVCDLLDQHWDLLIGHPPCTHLAVSGARHFAAKKASGVQDEALDFVRMLMNAPIHRIAIENPISIISSRIRKPDQIVQPYQFGHPEQKATCLWLKNLPLLQPTNDVQEYMKTLPKSERERVHRMPPGPDRWKERSRTYQGIAEAFAAQWG